MEMVLWKWCYGNGVMEMVLWKCNKLPYTHALTKERGKHELSFQIVTVMFTNFLNS